MVNGCESVTSVLVVIKPAPGVLVMKSSTNAVSNLCLRKSISIIDVEAESVNRVIVQ